MLFGKIRHFPLPVMLLFTLILTACKPVNREGGGRSAASEIAPVAVSPGVYTLDMPVSDLMQFPLKRFSLPAGSTLTLTLRHTGGMSLELMGHNWVLLDKETPVESFVGEASGAVDSDYVPTTGWDGAVLAKTRMLGGGQSDTITFEVPAEPGDYPYVCTFPGHFFAGMKGVLEVRGESKE